MICKGHNSSLHVPSVSQDHITKFIYIYIYGTPPNKKTMFTSLLLVLAIFCVYFGLPFDPWFFWGVPYIYIYIFFVHARRLHDLFVHFGRNAVRMRSMHSECIPAQYQDQDPRFAQKSCGKSWKYQDPRSKIPTRLLAKILEIPRSKIQDSHKTPVQILDLGLGIGQECILWHSLDLFLIQF